MSRKEMINHLNQLGIKEAIADKNASVNGSPAILLRWNGQEEYYIGFDIVQPGDDPAGHPKYQEWLIKTFGNK